MYEKTDKKGQVRFSFVPGAVAKKVELAGAFNDWKPVAMQKAKGGRFTKLVALPDGIYEYKFIVDGSWICDPDHSNWALNPYGTFNSIAEIR